MAESTGETFTILSPEVSSQEIQPPAQVFQQPSLNVPSKGQLKNMSSELNVILANLAVAVNSSEEKPPRRRELQLAQMRLDSLKQYKKHITESDTSPTGRTSPSGISGSHSVQNVGTRFLGLVSPTGPAQSTLGAPTHLETAENLRTNRERSIECPGNDTDNVSDLLRAQYDDPDMDVEPNLPSLKQVLPDEVLRKLKPNEKKRQEVINQLFYTERAHLRNLKVLDLLFNRPMYQEKGIMTDLARALFPNMEEMISLHVKDIKERSQSMQVVKVVGDLLLKRFDGEGGERFRKGCAEYCRNQAFALDALKKQTRKDSKLQQFLHDAESNFLCRRLQLKDLVPSQMQHLINYPQLIDNLLKYTQSQSEEYKRLERAHVRCKHILAYVNQAVKECENYHRLKDFQKKLDKRPLEGLNDPAVAELKPLDLTQHKLIFDSPLTWKLRSQRTVDLHVLLFEDLLVLLQKQDDKFVLKCQNTNVQPARDDKYTHSPVLKLQNLLARTLAAEKRSFFVVNISESRAQMYEFTAASLELRLKLASFTSESATLLGRKDKDVDPSDHSTGGLMQKRVILQQDEKEYGFTVGGDNPVFVASVKQDGAAARAGVQNGDRIVKVNGTLVTQRNHMDVVKLIKSGSYLALTLLGKPSPSASSGLVSHHATSLPYIQGSEVLRVTVSQPVNQ